MKKHGYHKALTLLISIFITTLCLPGPAFAADSPKETVSDEQAEKTETKVLVRNTATKKDDAVRIGDLRITGVEEPLKENDFLLDEYALVTSAEEVTWEIPVIWVDNTACPVQNGCPGPDCTPVLAFFLPDGYSVKEEKEGFYPVFLDTYLSGLFEEAGGVICIFEPQTKITYILAADMDPGFLNESDGKRPSNPVTGLPEELQKPKDGTYNNPNRKTGSSDSDGQKDGGQPDGQDDKDTPVPEEPPAAPAAPNDPGSSDDTDSSPGTDNSIEAENPADTDSPADPDGSVDQGGSADAENPGDTNTPTDQGGSADAGNPSDQGGSTDAGNPSDQGGSADAGQTGTGDGSDTSGAPAEPLTKEQLLGHCSSRVIRRFGEDQAADFVNLIINYIQPQAVRLIRNAFPAFTEASENDALGKEIGLYVYNITGDNDGVPAHESTSWYDMAYVEAAVETDKDGRGHVSYVISLNTLYFQSQDTEGNSVIDTSEQAMSDLDNTIVHEMLHAFMYDYNRTGTLGTPDPNIYNSPEDYEKTKAVYGFPLWFSEGLASSVENVYQFRYEQLQLLRCEGNGKIGDRYTPESLLNTYLTNSFVFESGQVYTDNYDLEASGQETTSTYVSGYLACLYLGEMAAKYENLGSSVTTDENGNRNVSSEMIRLGLNSILERLHNGESLDDIIRSISGGRYQNTDDFTAKFIKGADRQGDADSIDFCVCFLNYMQDVASNNDKIPNGSILFDFDRDFTTPIDRTESTSEDLYRITDSSDYVRSTVDPETPYTDGGKSDGSAGSAAETETGRRDTSTAARAGNDSGDGSSTTLPDRDQTEVEKENGQQAEEISPGQESEAGDAAETTADNGDGTNDDSSGAEQEAGSDVFSGGADNGDGTNDDSSDAEQEAGSDAFSCGADNGGGTNDDSSGAEQELGSDSFSGGADNGDGTNDDSSGAGQEAGSDAFSCGADNGGGTNDDSSGAEQEADNDASSCEKD